MKITLGKATGFEFVGTNVFRGFILMVRGREVSYVHFLEDFIGIPWNRILIIGERKWWLTNSWKTWAKKNKNGFSYALTKK
jgi:hypothetical protein